MPELRIDPIIGRRVYIAEDRAGRPSDYSAHEATGRVVSSAPASPAAHPNCPFCAGNEAYTPVAELTVSDAGGQWQCRVVPNKYPAVRTDQPVEGAFGAHEVIIESPEHLLDVTRLGLERLTAVVRVYRDRLRHWAAQPGIRHGLVFKNSGCDAGASLEHIHSQVTAVPFVLPVVERELAAAERFYGSQGTCIFCDLLQRELAAGQRVVASAGAYAVVTPHAPRQPYEMWLLPRTHAARFDQLADGAIEPLAATLLDALERLQAVAPGCPYNLLLHTAPFDDEHAASYHWHWEIVPRLAHEAGLEWGGGVHICPLSPENAAQRLIHHDGTTATT
ncbi:galactose-1-phosphate uridylyltransferase [Lacipirellula sp.]|uniref:galactose-1-phosphate uridylyltransferase n=1 Tax=Lacipirellula sp. TaxID=2691419 RepID=UPI003D15297D